MIKIAEISLYQLVDFIPNLILAFCTFMGEVRFSFRKNILLCVLLYITLTASRVAALLIPAAASVMSVLWIMIYLVFYRYSIRAKLSKLLFVLLTLLNYGSFIIIVETHFSFYVFSEIAGRPYSAASSLMSIALLILTYPFMYLLFKKKLRPLMEYSENTGIWRFLWLIPATFCLAYYYNLYANGGIVIYAGSINNVFFAVAFNAGALFVTYLILHLVEDSNAKLRLEADNYQFTLQSLQYRNLKAQMDETRRAKHDLRHTVNILHACLRDQNTKELNKYIEQYLNSLPVYHATLYCDDYILNSLISTYQEKAEKEKIDFHVSIQMEGTLRIPEPDKVVLLGNLLENALEACRRPCDQDACISLVIQQEEAAIIILVDNSYNGTLQEQGQGFLSSKKEHTGLGISSIQRIAEKYNGRVKYEHDDKTFFSSTMLFPHNAAHK